MLTIDQARQQILEGLPRVAGEAVGIVQASGRILHSDVFARRTLPPWDNSAMDGFAVRSAELPATLPVAGSVVAGDPPGVVLEPGTTLRIMTGAPLPSGADAVVMREEVDDQQSSADFLNRPEPGAHIRRAGDDIRAGDRLLAAGVALGPGEIAAVAGQGQAEVEVSHRPRVAILSTGDELVPIGTEPGPGQIVASSACALAAQVREAGGHPIDLGIAADRREHLIALLRQGTEADVLITTGGVSVGDFDLVKDTLAEVGVTVAFWRVAIKPGKPLVFGHTADGNPMFGLPGNPVSTMVGFELFVRPTLLAMQGASRIHRPRAEVVLAEPYPKRPGRVHFVRATLRQAGGGLEAIPLRHQGSGMLSSMVGVDALVEVPRDLGDVAAGTRLPALLLRYP